MSLPSRNEAMPTEDFLRNIFRDKKKRVYKPSELPDSPMSTEDFLRKIVFGEEYDDRRAAPATGQGTRNHGTVQSGNSFVPLRASQQAAADLPIKTTQPGHSQGGDLELRNTDPKHMGAPNEMGQLLESMGSVFGRIELQKEQKSYNPAFTVHDKAFIKDKLDKAEGLFKSGGTPEQRRELDKCWERYKGIDSSPQRK